MKRPRYVYAKPNGNLFFKHPKSGKLPLPALDADDFTSEYQRLMASVANNTLSLPIKAAHARHLDYSGAGSIGTLALAYFKSDAFTRLGRRTAHMRRLFIETCLQTLHPEPMADGKPAEFRMWHIDDVSKDTARDLRSALKYERTANGRPLKKGGDLDNWRDVRMWAMRAMFAWAVDKPYRWSEGKSQRRVNGNPFQRLGDLCQDKNGHRTWEQDDFDTMMAFLTREQRWEDRLALALMRYTLVRRSDVVRLGKDFIKNLAARGANAPALYLRFKEWKGSTSKTERRQNKERTIPILPELQQIIDTTPGAMERRWFLPSREGDSHLTDAHFGSRFNQLCSDAGLPEGSTCHGIRKFAATRMAENNASAKVIAAWGGWEDLRNVIGYTKAADNKKLVDIGAQFII